MDQQEREREQFLFEHALPRIVPALLARSRFDPPASGGVQAAQGFLLAAADMVGRRLQRRPDVSNFYKYGEINGALLRV